MWFTSIVARSNTSNTTTTHTTMNLINLDTQYTKSYATEANLAKGTAELDAKLDGMAPEHTYGSTRKMVCRNADGRWTAVYFLQGSHVTRATFIAHNGFMAIG